MDSIEPRLLKLLLEISNEKRLEKLPVGNMDVN
jgi:hypothetical protein